MEAEGEVSLRPPFLADRVGRPRRQALACGSCFLDVVDDTLEQAGPNVQSRPGRDVA